MHLTPNGKLVCPHGELSSTLCYWLADEKKAKLKGEPLPPRGGTRMPSSCDCCSTEGLNVAVDASVPLPAMPSSLFEFLEENGAELVKVKGLDARRVPHMPGPMFVTKYGKFVCRHGRSRAALCKKSTCGCVLKAMPVRANMKGLKMGLVAGPLKVRSKGLKAGNACVRVVESATEEESHDEGSPTAAA